MFRIKYLFSLVFLTLLFLPVGAAEENPWHTDWEKAQKVAEKQERPVLVNFTGSDWCIWCIRLEEEVFSKEVFKKYARENMMLMKVDFPRNIEQPEAVRKQNEKLARKYGIRGFPTVVIVDAEGSEIARTGYRRGGAEAYVGHLETIASENDKGKE